MTFFDTSTPIHRSSRNTARDDLIRLGLIGMVFATLAAGLVLAGRVPGSPLAAQDHTGVEWHGNVAASAER